MDARSLRMRAHRTTLSKRYRPKPLSLEVKRVLKALMFTLFILFLGGSLLFFFTTSRHAQGGYTLRQMEREYEKLRGENEALKQKVLEAQAFQNLETGKQIRGMEMTDRLLFIPVREEKISRSLDQ